MQFFIKSALFINNLFVAVLRYEPAYLWLLTSPLLAYYKKASVSVFAHKFFITAGRLM